MDLEDMSDSEQERFWEETMDAVEQELTQGHPHSEADEEANLNISASTSQSAGRRAPRTILGRRTTRSSKGPTSTPKTPSNTAAAAAASFSREGIRVKMPIMRPPSAPSPAATPRPTAPSPAATTRPTAPSPTATPRPNPPFRPPQIRPVGPTSTVVPGLGVANTTRTPVVSNETMNGASKATTSRFSKFMPNQSG
ncbi:protein transport protein sec31-like [Arachis ipaensis]|uniref:protein transport protein sec31-like n=1 Tax=Arachis ipaensis TaxID=130454 RepID=UPI0007AFB995|nr:protein transport protein sec31-like [Arachis ipaensis]XP_025661644.1 protein transport protein sec31-like [Arachis hypogaea]